MIVHGACRAGGRVPGQDRWARTSSGVIVLDGATAFGPEQPPADEYVNVLLRALVTAIDRSTDVGTVIADAIGSVTEQLDVAPGAAPSSTVALLRERGASVEVAALGDSTIVLGLADGVEDRLTDSRIGCIAPDVRARLRSRLRSGAGYDDEHRELLRTIQAAERSVRNSANGYWIAEVSPAAGHHAILRRYPRDAVRWAVLATDGAQRGLDHLGTAWTDLARATSDQLRSRLDELHRWEATEDPHGRDLPRSKRHDDKTLVTWAPSGGR